MSTQPTKEFLNEAVYLVDSSSYIFRAYYAIRAGLKAPDGTPTHATFGFAQMVLSLLDTYKPKHCVFIWDTKEKGFRHEIFEDYKANRGDPPEDLGVQIDNSKNFLSALSLPQLEQVGFEADDIIATLIAKNPNAHFVIVTSDKDLLQLVNENVWCLDTMKQKWSNFEAAVEKFGVPPDKIVEVQALSGDSVDNIPGAPGVGPKTATDLITYHGSLDKVLEIAAARAADALLVKKMPKEDPLKGKKIESLAENSDQVKLSLELVRLSKEAPVNADYDNFHQGDIDENQIRDLCERLGFDKIKDKILAHSATEHRRNKRALATEASLVGPSGSVNHVSGAPLPIRNKSLHFKTLILSSRAELENFFKKHEQEKNLSLDTETMSLESRAENNLVGISLAFTEDEGAYVPMTHIHGNNLGLDVVRDVFQRFWSQNKSLEKIIFQNGKFDLHVLKHAGFVLPENLIFEDTMLQSFVLDPTENHGMDALSAKYLNSYHPLSFDEVIKGVENFSEVPIDEAAFYAAEDAVVTFALHRVLKKGLGDSSKKLIKVYEELDRPLLPILYEMEEEGVHLDLERVKELSVEWNQELVDLESKAVGLLTESGIDVPEDFNLASPKQIAHVLFTQLQLPIIKKTKTGASTDVSVLEELSASHPFPQALLEVRELQKLVSTYVDNFPNLVDRKTGRIHTDFSQTVAATGRLASSKPNLQNIPIRSDRGKRIREAFSAPRGRLMLGVDYSQIEIRLLAHFSRDRHLIQAFHDNADIHRRTAALILGKDEEKITSDERRMAKTINFGIIYGQTAFGLSKQLGITKSDAQKFIDSYFSTYPGIAEFKHEAVQVAKKHGYSETLTGRRRPIPDIHSKNVPIRLFAERVAVNTPLQGTAADLIKAAMLEIYNQVLPNYPRSKLVLQVHDELLFESDADEVEALKNDVKNVMEAPGLLKNFGVKGFEVLMKAEASIGKNWGILK